MSQPSVGAEPQAGLTVAWEKLHGLCVESLLRAGLSEADAITAADVLVTTDAWGVHTHGTKALRGSLRRLAAGGLRARGRPAIASEGPAWAIVDGDDALGMVAASYAMGVAVDKARTSGVGYVGMRRTCHFGAAGYYAWLAARAGCIGISMANDTPSVAAPGSRGAVTGSNPIAYAVPAGRHPPMMLDMSVATVAGGKVYAARERGEPIPEGWLIGPDGMATTDPSHFPRAGALSPAAGHKGYGIALLVETLAGILTGAAVTWGIPSWMGDDLARPTNHGAAFMAIDIAAMMPGTDFARRMEALVDEVHDSPLADGAERVYVPGEREWEQHARAMRNGITLPRDVVASLREAVASVGLDLELSASGHQPS